MSWWIPWIGVFRLPYYKGRGSGYWWSFRPSHWPRGRDKPAIRLADRRLSEAYRHGCLWTVRRRLMRHGCGDHRSGCSGHSHSVRATNSAVYHRHAARPSSPHDRLCTAHPACSVLQYLAVLCTWTSCHTHRLITAFRDEVTGTLLVCNAHETMNMQRI